MKGNQVSYSSCVEAEAARCPATRLKPRTAGVVKPRTTGVALLVCALLLIGCRAPADPRRPVPAGDASRAPGLMQQYGCASCHTIPGVAGARGLVGPPLWAMADRIYIGGVLPNTEENMIRWLREPVQVNPRTAMPATGVTERDARDMTAYLARLRAESVAMRMIRGFIERAIGRQVPDPRPEAAATGEAG